MPWTGKDATKHTKAAKSKKEQDRWAKVASRDLAEHGDEGRAIRIANSVVKKGKKK